MWSYNPFSLSSFAIFVSFAITIYYYLTRNFNYWSSRGVKGPKPWIILGSFGDLLFKPLPEIEEDRIEKFGNIYGIFETNTPVIVVAEPQLIKNIMVKDFNVFVNRRDVKGDPILDRALGFQDDDEWKKLRAIMSPTFSSAKMKRMHKLVEECIQAMDKKLENVVKYRNEIEMKKLMADYATDVVASCAFATKIDTHNDPNNPFVTNAIKAFNGFRFLLFITSRPLMKFFNISLFDPMVENFFRNAILEILKQRRGDKNGRHPDFLQIMINRQKPNQQINNENEDNLNGVESHHAMDASIQLVESENTITFTDEDIVANSFLFFLGGYQTLGTLVSHLTYLLAINPECQQRLLEEVQQNTKQSGKIDYEALIRMPYLDACVSEALRLCNPAMVTARTASEDYKLGETGITIPKGMLINIPIHGLHHSSKYFPDPYRFNPDRFMPENKDKIIPYTYLPFGAGPRNCVGIGFTLMVAKTAIAALISKYKLFATNNTKIPLKYKMFKIQLTVTDITIGIQLRNTQIS